MGKAIQYGVALFLLAALVALGGCGAIKEQARMALDDYEAGLTAESDAGGEGEESIDDAGAEEDEPAAGTPAGARDGVRGRLEGSIYFNDFADLIFAPPEGWINGPGEADASGDEIVDFISRDPDTGSAVTILFEAADPPLGEEEYWEAELAELREMGYGGAPLEDAALGAYDYRVATLETPESCRRVYMRRMEGYTLSIVLEAARRAELDELVICFA